MGFGSYDESEQEKHERDSNLEDDEAVDADRTDHEGDVEYEIGASNDELLDRLKDIKEE